jgi:hypothetical protein
MSTNEIKKLLYKQNPTAEFQYIRKSVAYYRTVIIQENGAAANILFQVPVADMGDADFGKEMSAKLLIRWIMVGTTENA